MLSLVNSSDPSCSSSKVSGFRADERDSEKLPLQGTDLVARLAEAQSSNFSIRDYAFALRDKKIGKSWPFSSPLLQLCLKHGIRDLLPPFESPNSVRTRCFINSLSEAEKVTVSSSNLRETSLIVLDGEPNSTQTDHLCLPCSHQNDLLTCSDKFKEDKCDHKLVNIVCEIGSIVTNNCDIGILNPGVIPEEIQAEEESSTSTASDIMASKVCPVCKAFSSTSNTTLNAHMDQCLSMESDAALALEKMQKLKVKPSKKRLMEEIYATAPRCTLEDLDRRNGSSWATYLTATGAAAEAAAAAAAATATSEVDLEPKKPKLLQLGPRDDKNEGAVYVDSNGIKLRILSKFNESPQVLLREEIRPVRSIKSGQEGKIVLMKDKKDLTSRCSKKMKLKMRNKKLGSLKMFKKEIQKEHKVSHHEESHLYDERSPVQLSGEADQSRSCGSATLIKSWPSSKRSDLSKKFSKKEFHKILEQPKPDSQVEMLETMKLAASDTPSASKSHFGKLSHLLESKPMNFSSNTVQNKENQTEGTSANVLLKMSRSSGSLVSSPTSTSEEFYLGRKPKSHTYPKTRKRSADLNYIVPLKTKRVSTLSGSNSSAVKFRKHRSLLSWSDQRIREFSSDRNPKQHRSVEAIHSEQDEHMHPGGSQCQVDQNVNINTFENADSSSITPNPLDTQDQNLQLGANAITNLTMPIRAIEMPVAESLPDELDNKGVESQSKATSAEENSSACFTSHGDLRIDIPRENSTIALDPKPPTQETNKIVSNCRDPSTSPASSVSTISLASPSDYHSNASVLSTSRANSSFPFASMVPNKGTQGIDMQLEPDFTVKKSLQLPSDYHPCCCSWQTIMPPTKQKPLPNLHIRPSISSYYSHSSLTRTDAATTLSLESPTESILTRACSDVGSTSPSSGTPTQSSSNSILRLMGKDLMVVHHEDSAKLPKLHSPITDNNSNVHALNSQLGFAAFAVSNQSNFSFPVHNLPPSITNSEGLNCLPLSYNQSNKNHHKAKEVIVIDDSDDVFAPRDVSSHVPVSYSMFQSQFSYFPTQSHLLAMDNGIRIPNVNNQGSSVPVPHFPRPLLFQSPSATHLNSQFYCQQSLR